VPPSHQYTPEEAALLHQAALEKIAAAKSGVMNNNVRIKDPKTGRFVNVRIPLAKRPAIAWRTFDEPDIYDSLAGVLDDVTPRQLYSAPDGTFSIQEYVKTTPVTSNVVTPSVVHQMASFWRRLLDVELPARPHERRPLPEEMVAYLTAHTSAGDRAREVPRTLGDYRELHVDMTEADFNRLSTVADFLYQRFKFPGNPEHFARQALEGLSDVSLAPSYPDLHRGNFGKRAWRLFVYDVELIGHHDPRHTLAVAMHWGNYYPAQQRQILAAHEAVAPEYLRYGGFAANVRRWSAHEAVHTAVRQVGRIEPMLGGADTPRALTKTLNLYAPWLTNLVNDATKVWAPERKPFTARFVQDTLAEAADLQRRLRRHREAVTGVALAATGFGSVAAGLSETRVYTGSGRKGDPANGGRYIAHDERYPEKNMAVPTRRDMLNRRLGRSLDKHC